MKFNKYKHTTYKYLTNITD